MIFEGCSNFRTRIILSLLSGKPVKIRNIRSQENEPGLKGTFLLTQNLLKLIIFLHFRVRSKFFAFS